MSVVSRQKVPLFAEKLVKLVKTTKNALFMMANNNTADYLKLSIPKSLSWHSTL